MRSRATFVVTVAGALLVACASSATAQGGRSGQRVSGAQPSTPPSSLEWLDLTRTYLKALRAHRIGVSDDATELIAKWPTQDVTLVGTHIGEMVRTLQQAAARDARAGREQPFSFAERSFTRTQFRQWLGLEEHDTFITDPNDILKLGALFHMDIAMYARVFAATPTEPSAMVRRAFASVDGHLVEVQDNSLHWAHARRLLDAVALSSSDGKWVRQWYVATTAWLADHKMWSVCLEQASSAEKLFPNDAQFPFARGVIHEVFALPRMQAARDASVPGIEDARAELGQAGILLRKALTLDRTFAEAHLHYGHVLSALGNLEEAVRELKEAESGVRDVNLRYFAALFLGWTEGQMGDRDAAAASFERAAREFPRAQSPLLGLSQVARQADDGFAASEALERLFALPRLRGAGDDPWLDYDRSHSREADTLVGEVRRSFRGAGQ